jgi:hypothetical protein
MISTTILCNIFIKEVEKLILLLPIPLLLGPFVLIVSVLIQVVEAPNDPLVNQDGAALSAFQYFENLRNFLVFVEEMGIPTFEVSDFEKVMVRFESMVIIVIQGSLTYLAGGVT